jgi:hypothetical protein
MPAKDLYGRNGPSSALGNQSPPPRPMTTKMPFRSKGSPGPDRIDATIAKVPGLSARQRDAVRQAFVELMKGGR